MELGYLVQDWGGFEKLVAALHETGDVSVEHNVQLVGRSGASRQIDVLIRHKQGLYEHLVVVECKYWNSPVERLHVDALATTVREVGAAKGVIFSTHGFQSGARTQASQDNIDLFKVRDLTDEEWGLPGKVVDVFLHVIAISLGNPRLIGSFSFKGVEPKHPELALRLGDPSTDSDTPMHKEGEPETSLEPYLYRVALESAKRVCPANAVQFGDGSYNGKLAANVNVNIAPKSPIRITVNGGVIMIPRLEFDLGVSILQSRITVDRSSNYLFALAVEDCVRGKVVAARRKADAATSIDVIPDLADINHDDVLKNGSLISVWVKGLAPFEEFADLKPGQWVEV